MDLTILLYSFLSVAIITGGTYYFYSSYLETAAAIYFLGTVVAAIYFGFRWFTVSGATATGPGSWPPAINYCPDFMTLTTDVNGKKVCIDMIGVAQGGTANIQVSDGTQTTDAYTFDLRTASTITRIDELCGQAKAQGVTWEGVWNGTTCSGNAPPLPP
jgi:hypothetical protein